jgi:hypothetical protein
MHPYRRIVPGLCAKVFRARYQLLFIASLHLTSGSVVLAQQTCLSPTEDAGIVVDLFLTRASNRPWLDTLGITAAGLDDVIPLADSTDGALCRRMDSTFVVLPAYYYRAGRYILGANHADPLTSPWSSEWKTTVFVFDSTGRRVRRGSGVIVPADLHPTTALDGQVQLAWTTSATDVISYRLQRAAGSGPYAFAGSTLPGTTRSATDTTAHDGNTYSYRLVAYRSAADSGFSNVVSVTLDLRSVTRTTAGLLFKDDFNRADQAGIGNGWSVLEGSFRIEGNVLDDASTTNPERAEAPIAARGATTVQVRMAKPNASRFPGIVARWDRAANSFYYLYVDFQSGAKILTLGKMVSGGFTQITTAPFAWGNGVLQQYKFVVEASRQRAYAEGALAIDVADAALDNVTGTAGMRDGGGGASTGDEQFEYYILMAGNTVTIDGLPVGYKLRCNGVLSAAAVGGAPVSIDMGNATFPLARIEILDVSGALVKVYAPSDGVWGGDHYSLGEAP